MSLQLASVVETYFDIERTDDSAAAELSTLKGCDVLVGLAAERHIQPQNGLFLTLQECRVLREISHGASNKQVARLLDISPSTVRTHVESIFNKLGCSTRAAATFKAATMGLIS